MLNVYSHIICPETARNLFTNCIEHLTAPYSRMVSAGLFSRPGTPYVVLKVALDETVLLKVRSERACERDLVRKPPAPVCKGASRLMRTAISVGPIP